MLTSWKHRRVSICRCCRERFVQNTVKYNTKLTADYAEVTVMLSDDLVNWQETKNITTLSQSLSNNLDIEFLIRFENQMHEENLDMKFIKLKVEVSP